MWRISILAHDRDTGRKLSGWLGELCAAQGILPRMDTPEHLRKLCPDCAVIWCSDPDFSLQAYRLRVEYFILGPPSREEMTKGLSIWLDRRGRRTVIRNEVAL